jgi:hypothetical protein
MCRIAAMNRNLNVFQGLAYASLVMEELHWLVLAFLLGFPSAGNVATNATGLIIVVLRNYSPLCGSLTQV